MAMHKLRITQVTRVERSIEIEVEAGTLQEAIELQQESDAPSAGDPRWKTDRDELMNEEVEAA